MSPHACIPWVSVSSRIAFRLTLALLLVVGVQLTSGAASQAVAELSALSCCAHDCGHAPMHADSSRCCGVASRHADTAAVAPAMPGVTAPLLAVIGTSLNEAIPSGLSVAASAMLPGARAAPVFLLTRTLRL